MFTFSEHIVKLNESSDESEDIHYDTNVHKLKYLARKSARKISRFVISKNGELHGADGNIFLHDDIAEPKDQHIIGAVRHYPETNSYSYSIYQHFGKSKQSHPLFNSFKNAGIEKHDKLDESFGSSKQTLRDRNNIIIGFIETDSNGLLKLIDRKDKILGFYDPKKDMTTNRLGIKVGTGNLLPSLIESVNESLLEYHKTLNQKLFDGEILRPEVRMTLLKIAETWQKFSKIPNDIV